MQLTDHIPPQLMEQVLTRLGLDDRPVVDLEGLTRVYRAWCENVPFDNVIKRVYFGEGRQGPMPGTAPAEFLQNFVDHGTGGTCWVTSGGLFAVLVELGFDARRVSGNMVGVGEFDEPNHGSTAVVIDGSGYLVDSSILSHDPIPLRDQQDSESAYPLQETTAQWTGSTWRINWLPGHGRDHLVMQLDGPGLGEARDFRFWEWRSEVSRTSSFFNDALYIRKSVLPGIRTIGRGKLISIDPPEEVAVMDLTADDQRRILVETFGLSEEIVARIPPDSTDGLALG
jgi:N-hydroxyarylamine O-acetyltransferase